MRRSLGLLAIGTTLLAASQWRGRQQGSANPDGARLNHAARGNDSFAEGPVTDIVVSDALGSDRLACDKFGSDKLGKTVPDPGGKEIPSWLRGAAVLATFGTVLYYERRRPLRPYTQDKTRRDLRNLAMAMLAGLTIQAFEKPVTDALTAKVQQHRWGLLKRRKLPFWLETACAVVLLDYSMYIWHVLTHKVPLLWRFHRVHHLDLDLDSTTALRFHFGEMLWSVPWRAMQITTIGASRLSLSLWQSLTVLAILFHHSNLRLPIRVEGPLSYLLMTPRMHGIHHSVRASERDSNWSTIFSFPDYLHRSRRVDVAQEEITVGIPEARDEDSLTLGRLAAMPFTEKIKAEGQPAARATER